MNLENISIFFLTFFIHPKIKIMIARFPRFVIINSKYNNNYFDLAKEENQRICFNYRNLQPLWAEENNKKHDLVPENVEELVQFLKQEIFHSVTNQ